MSDAYVSIPTPSELIVNLVKDGGRAAMYGGDPYVDDVERVIPSSPPGGAEHRAKNNP